MIAFSLPNGTSYTLAHLVLDFNGTLAVDGQLIEGVSELLNRLSEQVAVHIITADTFGTVRAAFAAVPAVSIHVLAGGEQSRQKLHYIEETGAEQVIAIGNGRNDALMLKGAKLGIAVIQAEGAAVPTVWNADLVFTDIRDALTALLKPKRLIASLRQ